MGDRYNYIEIGSTPTHAVVYLTTSKTTLNERVKAVLAGVSFSVYSVVMLHEYIHY